MGPATVTELSVGPPAPLGLQSWPPPAVGHPCGTPSPAPTRGHRGPAGPGGEWWTASDVEGPHTLGTGTLGEAALEVSVRVPAVV